MPSPLIVPRAAVLLVVLAAPAAAQQRSLGGTSLFGGGQSAFGGGAGGQSAFGQSGFGQSSFGQSSFGQGGFGQFGGQAAFGTQNGSGFVGRDGGDAAAFFQQLGRGSDQFLNRLERSFNRGGNRGRNAQATQEQRPPVRVQLRLGFKPPTPTVQQSGASVDRIANGFASKGYTSARVSVRAGVAVLTGSVPGDADRRLAERLARIEPGVSRVENLLKLTDEPEELTAPAAGT